MNQDIFTLKNFILNLKIKKLTLYKIKNQNVFKSGENIFNILIEMKTKRIFNSHSTNRDILLIIHDKTLNKFKIEFRSDFDYKEDFELFNKILNFLINEVVEFNKQKIEELKNQSNEKNKLHYSFSSSFFQSKCAKAEKTFYLILNPNSRYYKKGLLIYHNSNLIGVVKFKLNRTFLSFKTNENNIKLQKLTIYDLPKKILQLISKITLNQKDWKKVNLIGELEFGKYSKKMNEFNYVGIQLEEIKHENLEKSPLGYKQEIISFINHEYEQHKNSKEFDMTINLEKLK